MSKRDVVLLGAVTAMMLAGCGPRDEGQLPAPALPTAVSATPQALFDNWKAIVMAPEKAKGSMSHVELALQLSMQEPEFVDKMIDLLVDPATGQESRFLILNSLEAAQTPESYPRLLTLTQPEIEPSLRAGVVLMLKNSIDPLVIERLRELTKDPERRVRMAALMVLSEKGEKEMRSALQEYYFADGLPKEHRARILHSLGLAPEASDLKVFAAAANDAELPDESRLVGINGLGVIGDPAGVAPLEQCAAGATAPAVKEAAEKVAKALREKPGPAPAP